MINVILPEEILINTLKNAISFVKKDFDIQTDETKSYLYKLLSGSQLDRYQFFSQAKKVICCESDSPRVLKIDLAYNKTKDSFPSIHITLPGETMGPIGNGIGTDEGYADYVEEEEGLRAVFSRRISAQYSIVIMSDNMNEVVFLYHFLRALMIALIPHLHISGLSNLSFSGQDAQSYQELSSHNIYIRALNVSLQYDTFVPSIYTTDLITDINNSGTPTV